ncbi:MAG: RNA polymerase sigma-70 factor [Bacteroidota bacterium]
MPVPSQENDPQLIVRLRAGDATALDELFRRHYVELCQVANRFVRNEQQAEDLIQDLFASLWEKRTNLPKDLSAIGAYLRRSARNRSLNYLRDQKRIPLADGEIPTSLPADPLPDALETSELQQRINRAIDKLPERCRMVFVMSKLEDMSHRDIADSLDISTKTVENQMTRAYRFLRQWLSLILLLAGWP